MYKVIDEISGERVTDTDTVVINQRIMLADGSVIADSYKAGMPEVFIPICIKIKSILSSL